jgi:comEA protein
MAMKRVGVWLTIGLLALSLVFLLKPRAGKKGSALAVEPLTRPAEPTTATERGAAAEPAATSDERLNINTASVEELESLPGIGAVTAQRIVEFRENHGSFARPEDLMIIEGIGEKKYRALADLIRVE